MEFGDDADMKKLDETSSLLKNNLDEPITKSNNRRLTYFTAFTCFFFAIFFAHRLFATEEAEIPFIVPYPDSSPTRLPTIFIGTSPPSLNHDYENCNETTGLSSEYCEAKDGAECNEFAQDGTVADELCGVQCANSYGAPCSYNHICYNLTGICQAYGSTGQSDAHIKPLVDDPTMERRLDKVVYSADDDLTSDCDPHMKVCWGCAATWYLTDNFDLPSNENPLDAIYSDYSWAHYHIELLNMLPTVCLQLTLGGFNTSCTLYNDGAAVDCSDR